MDNTFETKKNAALFALTSAILKALEEDEIDDSQAQAIARTILDKKEAITDEPQLQQFLHELKTTWEFLASVIAIQEQNITLVSDDRDKINEVKAQLARLAQLQNNLSVN